MQGLINEMLVWLSVLEEALAKGVEWGLGPVAGSCSQFNCENRVSPSHSEEGPWARVVEYETDIFGLALVVICIADGNCDAESSVGPILHEQWSRMGVLWQAIDQLLIGSVYYNRWRGQSDALEEWWRWGGYMIRRRVWGRRDERYGRRTQQGWRSGMVVDSE